jgi:hypothetical protein
MFKLMAYVYIVKILTYLVQRTGFEPAKHYALGPHPSPFDHSGTSAFIHRYAIVYFTMMNNLLFQDDSISAIDNPFP